MQSILDPQVAQRIKYAVSFREADRVPVCDFIDNVKIFEYYSRGAGTAPAEKIKAYQSLAIDICWRFERRRKTRAASVWEPLKKLLTVKELPAAALTREELGEEIADFKEQQRLFAPRTHLAMSAEGCLSIAYHTMGFELFCEKMYTEPLETEKIIDIYAENLYQRASAFAAQELGELFFITDDIAYKKGLIFAPEFLRKQWLPKISQAIKPLKDKNIRVILHSDGNISGFLDEIIDAGIDGIHPIDRSADMDIGMIKKQYFNKLLLFGNVIISAVKPEEIIRQTKECLEKAAGGGGYFMSSNAGIDSSVELQDVFTYFSSINDFGKYPILP